MHNIKNKLLEKYFFIKNKIIVVESDDWGFAHIYNKEKYKYIKKFITNFNSPYAYFTIESSDDLNLLQKILLKHKDSLGCNFQITTNFIVQEPDFKKITSSNYSNIYFKDINVTKYKDIIENKLFYPQYHGRHHFNIIKWKYDLLQNKNDARYLVDNEVFVLKDKNLNFYNGENATVDDQIVFHEENHLHYLITDGLKIFQKLFGFSSKSVIAPSYYKNDLCDRLYKESNLFILQADNESHLIKKNNKFINKQTKLGEISLGMVSLVRNLNFEPSYWFFMDQINQNIERKIKYLWSDIKYLRGEPLIYCSHSYNYIGGLNKEMAIFSVNELDKLLKYLSASNLIYLNSEQLGYLLKNKILKHNGKTLQIKKEMNTKILLTVSMSYCKSFVIQLIIMLYRIKKKFNQKNGE